jgi:cytochrome c
MKTLFLLPALAAIIATTPALAQAADGGMLFKQRCQMCHGTTPSALAPGLTGVVGRKAGSATFNYSPALKASKIVWTRDTLDKYLAGPTKLVPGTRMVISVPDAAQRAAIVGHLAKLK